MPSSLSIQTKSKNSSPVVFQKCCFAFRDECVLFQLLVLVSSSSTEEVEMVVVAIDAFGVNDQRA